MQALPQIALTTSPRSTSTRAVATAASPATTDTATKASAAVEGSGPYSQAVISLASISDAWPPSACSVSAMNTACVWEPVRSAVCHLTLLPSLQWYALVASAEFFFNDVQNEGVAEQMRERLRFLQEVGRTLRESIKLSDGPNLCLCLRKALPAVLEKPGHETVPC